MSLNIFFIFRFINIFFLFTAMRIKRTMEVLQTQEVGFQRAKKKLGFA